MASNSTGAPSISTILPRCRSPWQRRTKPARSRALEQARARARTPRALPRRAPPPLPAKQLGRGAQFGIVLRDDLGQLSTKPALCADRRRRMRLRHRAAERVGQRVIDARRARPDDRASASRRNGASPPPIPPARLRRRWRGAVGRARDRHHAAIDRRRERAVDRDLGLAGALALVERGIIEERKAHRALDLERALARQEYRRGMGVDARHLRAAMVAAGRENP